MVRLRDPAGLPTLREIEEAESRIRQHIPPTPLEYSPGLSSDLGREVLLKLEVHQPIRVFKIRGALNKLLLLGDSALKRGVITASSGNHGLAVAFACRKFRTRAVICVPKNANPQKLAAIEEQGAEIVKSGAGYDDAYQHALDTARRRNLTFVHAFDDRDVIAGQGTCGLEMARQAPDLGAAVVAIGGGGLISGIAIALKGSLEKAKVYGAETRAIPSMFRSLEEGRPFRIKPRRTVADGMQAAIPGELTFAAVSRLVDRIGLVDDPAIERAVFDMLVRGRVLAEPSGAAPLAALRGPLRNERARKTALVVSGGNISMALLSRILNRGLRGRR